MKRGFTLIELLAVIVILAIIALIATPIILSIINDARKESNERSAELYVSAVRNAIASYQLTHPNAPTSFDDLDIQYDGEVECAKKELYADGSFYIAECTVNGDSVDYTYGEQQITQVYKPQYYSWSSGNLGEDLPNDAKTTVAELNPSYPVYLGIDVEDGKVSTAYVCFVRNETEYCLNPNDFVKSTEVIKDAYADVVDTDACSFVGGISDCDAGGLSASALDAAHVDAIDDSVNCIVSSGGHFECREL